MQIGDSLSRSIDKGLAKCSYGVVVLSPSFLRKDWPEYELRGLTAKEIGGKKTILPVWHNISRDDILAYSPTLADKFAISSNGKDVRDIALELIKVMRPDIFTSIHRKLRWEEQLRDTPLERIDPSEVVFGPIVHDELSPSLIGRIRLIRAALWGVDTHSMKVWVDGFKRDLHPEQEVEWWEHISACYLEFSKTRKLTRKQIDAAFAALFLLGNGEEPEALEKYRSEIGEKDFRLLTELQKYRYPILDVKEEFPERGNRLPDEAYEKIRDTKISSTPMHPRSED
ncbi:TIR domain-containing protein [Burkholderia stabilis]|uniref:TIR domain-containing protein n=1 Tax=Burkholderia stabilis TaxID=95485 RepID=A0A4Q2AE99_9BURK|nr:toll/interleukin-1 receptor domain-containing protein [Burkholderia stabilis]RXV67869.1 TIR domain-containing protein [Burkholderia stabilis]